MSLVQTRGGIPAVRRETIDTTGRKIKGPFYSSALIARNKGANIIRMYFTEKDFDDDANYVELPVSAASEPYGEWAGPAETCDIWFRAAAATSAIELVTFQRRG